MTEQKQKINPWTELDKYTAVDYLSQFGNEKIGQIYLDMKKVFGEEIDPRLIDGRPETMKEWTLRLIRKIFEVKGVAL